ncbi:aminoglycoside phosphotransferase [Actinomadura sp. WAC 06369]|uniref:aminoglycoside phosphotransferase n=1 Tax=Actinomadura sp. WAC 06369 TaxID=2203193 RepID=UPI000F7B1250|nr:aminoglycoside phosphotransferase [Actinomadura sp. WAC 06369]RSN46885.1 aminoglycoside phosphotransferase [Actinomadura sp. WAC 06369]
MTERLPWRQAQELIEKHTGPALSARPVQEGYNSELSVVINNSVFVKGMRVDHPRVWTQERERQINPHVRDFSARLLWSEVSGGWDLNGFEFLDGRQATYTPSSSDLGLIVTMMDQWPPAPDDVELKQASDRWAAYSDRPELFAGRWLAHTDWSPSNVLVVNGTARMLDWAWPTTGARWIDPACWIVWLIASGHTPAQAEAWANRLEAFATAPTESVTAFADAQAAMWADIGEHAPHPGLAAAAAHWTRHRTG